MTGQPGLAFPFLFPFNFFEARGPAGSRERRCRSLRRTNYANFAQCASECGYQVSVALDCVDSRSSSVVREKRAEILKQLHSDREHKYLESERKCAARTYIDSKSKGVESGCRRVLRSKEESREEEKKKE